MYKILYVNHIGQISGAERVLQNLLARLNRKEYEPIITAPESGRLLSEFRNQGIKVYPIQTSLLVRTKNFIKLLQYLPIFWKVTKTLKLIIKQEKIDLIHANSFSAHLYCILAAKLTHCPLIWHMHDILTPRWFNRLFIRYAGKKADKIIAVSNAVRNSLISFGISTDKIVVVYNGMNCELPIPSLVDRQYMRKELKIPEEAIIITMVGTITPWKGQDIFIRAANQLVQSTNNPELRFVIVGDIVLDKDVEYKTGLYKLVEQLGIKDRVIFTGFRPDIPLIMATSDMIIHSSIKPDPLPTVILEAMLLKKPVIAARLGGVPEIIEPAVTGLLFAPENVAELAAAMQQLSLEPELRIKLGDIGRKRIEQLFNIEQNITAIQSIYHQVLSSAKS